MNRTIFCIIICCFCIFMCKLKETEKPKIKKIGNIDKPLNLSLHGDGGSISIVNDSIIFTTWRNSRRFSKDREFRGKLTDEQQLKIKEMVSDLNQEYFPDERHMLHDSPCILKIDNQVHYEKVACGDYPEFTYPEFPPMPKEIWFLFRYIVDLSPIEIMGFNPKKNNPPPPVTQEKGIFTDKRDGKVYKTIKIGEQVWLAENLNYKVIGSKCYNDSTAYCDKYGRLYNWETAMKACPKGWHLSSYDEWEDLTEAVGGGEDAERYLIDTSGFSVLKGGSGYNTFGGLKFSDVGVQGYWWIASKHDSKGSYRRFKFHKAKYISEGSGNGDKSLFSVRCIRD